MTSRVLVATDGSPRSQKAIEIAVGIAKGLGASLLGCTATPPYPYHGMGDTLPGGEAQYQAAAGAAAADRLSDIERAAGAAGVPCATLIMELQHPHRAILQAAQENDCELIVMASHGRSEVSALFIGSETQKVLAFADRPVLVVR